MKRQSADQPTRGDRANSYFAHSGNAEGRWHRLRDHLSLVGRLALAFAGAAPWAGEAQLAGLLHDLGKYGDRFQARLCGEDSGLDHWSVGAWLALSRHRAVAAALAIQGHHVGLQGGSHQVLQRLLPRSLVTNHPLRLALSDPDPERVAARAQAEGLAVSVPAVLAVGSWARAVAAMVDVRMLFSCLADADFLDTEAHFNGDAIGKRYRAPGPALDPDAALAALDRFMNERICAGAKADGNVLEVRESVWRAAGVAAALEPSVFTLTAPTGSGKTLAMLRFALEHARKNQLKRIVLAVPFLTVIEQTARIYRQVFAGFPECFVLEHHSLAGLGEESEIRDAEGNQERQRRLLAEDWDAPIVLTTNVQMLESLFSNRPSACRKLHNLMESVILFDEAQSLPQQLAVPTLAALSHLSATYRTSVVFATATQPAFDALDQAVTKHAASGWRPIEVVPEHPEMFRKLRRVEVVWPTSGEKRTWAGLAEEVRSADSVLVVVNLKRHALALLEALRDATDVFHLSTNLCAEHRRAVLDRVRARLGSGLPCRLISTQCVEAGVDVDFPKVYRALAPLEAIAQAAGRCNREGRMNARKLLGEVVVFEPEEIEGKRGYPSFAYYQAAEVTRTLLGLRGELDINDPATFQAYYRRLYDLSAHGGLNAALDDAIAAVDFAEVARQYRLIDPNAIQVLVPWTGLCFTRPEMKVERFSYPVITPSAARGIFDAIYWDGKREGKSVRRYFYWQVTRIEVLEMPRYIALRRNEVKGRVPAAAVLNKWMNGRELPEPLSADGDDETTGRTQRQSMALKNVRYRITARIEPKSGQDRGKLNACFERRARSGKCFQQPYFGCREFPAFFEYLEKPPANAAAPLDQHLGFMLYDVFDLRKELVSEMEEPFISLFDACVRKGVLEVPPFASEKVRKPC